MEGRAKGRDRKDWKVNLKPKMENWRLQTTRRRSIRGTMDVNTMNNNMEKTACFAGRFPLDPLPPIYHIAVV